MKKIMYIEIFVLAVVLIVAIIACATLTGKTPAADTTTASAATSTGASTQDTTEPSTQDTTEPGPTWMTTPAGRQLLAQQYFVYDVNADTYVTTSASGDTRVYPASVTKLFTAYIALQYLEPDTAITAGDALDLVAWGSSVAKLGKDDTLTAEQLVEAMLLPSGNDAAYVLAAAVGRIIDNDPDENAVAAVQTFMKEMNSQAQSLGMSGSHFVNPDGIHSDAHYMSYDDLCLLGKLSLENETIMRYANVSRDVVDLPSQLNESPENSALEPGQVEWKNTNKLIHQDSEYYCPYAVGLKTGQTPTAGSCLLSAFEKDGKQWIIGVFGCPEEDDRFDDTIQLFNQTLGID